MERTKQSKSQSRIEFLSMEAFRSDGFLLVNKTLVKTLGLVPANLLSNYIDKYHYFNKKFPQNNGWFFFTHEQQMEQLGISEGMVRRNKQYLILWGMLEVKRRGLPAKEWFKINFEMIIKAIESYLSDTGQVLKKPPALEFIKSPVLIKDNKNKDIKKNIIKKDKTSFTERNKKYLPIAEMLAKIILTKKNMKYTSIQISYWTNDIRQLVENNQVSIVRINTALSWYSKNIGGEYIPVIESGYSLKNKFTKLEDAMERRSFSKSKPPIRENGKTYIADKDGDYFDREGRPYM